MSYIKKSDFVVTNSFHGTVFSIIYHKNFVTIANDKRNSRIEELLSAVGLSDRLLRSNELERIDHLHDIDYSEVDKKIAGWRERSEKLLRVALEAER